MLTISKPLASTQLKKYHSESYVNARENYYTEGDHVRGEWHGRLASDWGLTDVNEQEFGRLCEGQHPLTGEQLVHHQTSREYIAADGKTIRTMERRAGWDGVFSAPKSISIASLPGGDERVRIAHRQSVNIALDEMERFVQARLGGNRPPETTGAWIVAKFEHDSSRPVDGYAAPQLHTHAVIINATRLTSGAFYALQPRELFRSQRYATAVYRAELAVRLQELGFEIERGPHGSPEIKGFSAEYLQAASPRRQQVKDYMAQHQVFGAEAAEIAAHQTRQKKRVDLSREEVLMQHRAMAQQYGNQPEAIVATAHKRYAAGTIERDAAQFVGAAVLNGKDRNIEREAVISERAILTDALRHGMGRIVTSEARAEFGKCIQTGELIEVIHSPSRADRIFTTPEMKQYEIENVQYMVRGLDQHDKLASDSIQQKALVASPHLSASQQSVVREILNSRDQMIGLEGLAGTGKTTTLEAVCDAAKRTGLHVEGLAPTARAALNLEGARIQTKTLARHLTENRRPSPASNYLYVVDESGMTSTRQMHDFLKSIRIQDRVLLIGDVLQHEGVDAGRPYAQLQEAGMHTARLTEIIRQKDPGLKRAVEQLATGDTEGAIENLKAQGRVHEFTAPEERIQAIARTYAKSPESTLIVSPDNASRMEIAKKIHEEMQGTGKVSQQEQVAKILVTRQELTNEDRRWAQNYEAGDVLRYAKSSRTIKVIAGERVRVHAIDEKNNLITVERQNGERIAYDPRRVQGVAAYREEERSFAVGDRIQFTAAYRPQRVVNRELGTIEQIDETGNLRLQMDSGRRVGFNLKQHPHLDYGYAVTSHSSQSETIDRVLIHIDAEHVHKGLINNRMAYVSVSRARNDAQIFTNDAASLGRELGKDVSHSAALQPFELKQATVSWSHNRAEQSVGHAL